MIQENIVDTLIDNYMPYATYVIKERALPEIDGLKPSQRRILYAMYKMGLLSGNRKKCQTIVGETMKWHPHGDSAVYETLVRMTKDAEVLTIPLIDSKGNFGKVYSKNMAYASARYTESKLEAIVSEFFNKINKNAVDFVENYDNTTTEPKLLPVSFPSILCNPISGTAVGMASNFIPFNINEIIDFTIAYIYNPKTANPFDHIKAPDFSTGANYVRNDIEMQKILSEGKGSLVIRANYKIVDDNTILFEELPFNTTYEAIIDKIVGFVKDGKMREITDIHDVYGIDTQGIEITVKNGTNKELLIEKLFATTPLESSVSCNFNMISTDGTPKTLGVRQIIHEWLGFRANTIRRIAGAELQEKAQKKHMLLALKQVLLNVDKAIVIIKNTRSDDEVIEKLMKEFSLDKEQAEYVADIKLKYLNKQYITERINEINNLTREIDELNNLIINKKAMAMRIIYDLEKVKSKHGRKRKTQIITVDEKKKQEAVKKEEPNNYNVKVYITNDGYVKKVPLTSLRVANQLMRLKEGDFIIDEIDTTNNADLIVFTNEKNTYKCKLNTLTDSKLSNLGEYMPTLLGIEKDEVVLYATVTENYDGKMIIVFDDGKVAKVDMSAWETKQNRRILVNGYADKNAVFFKYLPDKTIEIDLIMHTKEHKTLIFNTSNVNIKSSKITIGSQAMKLRDGDTLVLCKQLDSSSNIEDIEYYRLNSAGVGKYLKKGDTI